MKGTAMHLLPELAPYLPVIAVALLVALSVRWLLKSHKKAKPIACSLCGAPVSPGSPGQYDAQVCGECWGSGRKGTSG